jgi:hypothetical protein
VARERITHQTNSTHICPEQELNPDHWEASTNALRHPCHPPMPPTHATNPCHPPMRMRNLLPFETRNNIFQAFITPHFNYCADTWLFCIKSTTEKLERINERAIRYVFHHRDSSYHEQLTKLGQTTLLNQRLIKIVCTVFVRGTCLLITLLQVYVVWFLLCASLATHWLAITL